MLFEKLQEIDARPEPFACYTARALWTDDHTAGQMLSLHLHETGELASRNAAFIRDSVAWILHRFAVSAEFSIADFGCGPGLYALPLARRGARVTGIDISASSITYAAGAALKEGLSVCWVRGDYLDFEMQDRFDLILMIMCDFSALAPAQRRRMLSTFRTLLKPGGHVLLDVYSLAGFAAREESTTYEANPDGGFWSASPHHVFTRTFKYDGPKVVLDKYTIVERERVRTIANWFQHFSLESLQAEFSAQGLEVLDVHANVAGAPFKPESTEFAVVASAA
jgi:SAM-dependent methyltransferase